MGGWKGVGGWRYDKQGGGGKGKRGDSNNRNRSGRERHKATEEMSFIDEEGI